MSDRPAVAEDSVTVHVPMTFRRHGGRKRIVLPESAGAVASLPEADKTLVKALARAFRWRKLLENGHYTGVEEIATTEKVSAPYVSRILRLTLLAPDIVEAILDGRQEPKVALEQLRTAFPVQWSEQHAYFFLGW